MRLKWQVHVRPPFGVVGAPVSLDFLFARSRPSPFRSLLLRVGSALPAVPSGLPWLALFSMSPDSHSVRATGMVDIESGLRDFLCNPRHFQG
jgi:hypothetical protein